MLFFGRFRLTVVYILTQGNIMTDRHIRLASLIAGHLRQELSLDDRAELERWLAERPENKQFLDELSATDNLHQKLRAYHDTDRSRLWEVTQRKLSDAGIDVQRKQPYRIKRLIPYAAAVLISVATAAWFMYDRQVVNEPQLTTHAISDIPPGGNRATLTLGDGSTIVLDEAQDGIVVESGSIVYNDRKPLIDIENTFRDSMLTLSTPPGGTYRIALPDGTEVWLNAASTLKYPSQFTASERVVELTGEAYFSVKEDAERPFKIVSSGQLVEVMGTAFNISAYPDEMHTYTTLVSGAVRLHAVHNSREDTWELRPGQHAINHKIESTVNVLDVDVTPYIAWKSGMFHFKNTPFSEVMRQIELWYDVEVVYKRGIPDETFGGRMRRDVSLLTVLDLLKASEINFHLEGQQLIIE